MGDATACDNSKATLTAAQMPAIRRAESLKRLRNTTSADITIARADAGNATNNCQNRMVVGESAKQIKAAAHVAVT
jgi:hypothetical protein